MYHILIVGAGQLGSRHLQASASIELPVEISVVDPSQESLNIAQERLKQIDRSSSVSNVAFYNKLSSLDNKNVDICVLATNAQHRLAVLKELLSCCGVSNLILEKILFQSVKQMGVATELLSLNSVNAWVNCPRRMFPLYNTLKNKLGTEGFVNVKVTGNDWGLACNAIHFIDLWSFLSGRQDYDLDLSKLKSNIVNSKRKGFKEVEGSIVGRGGRSAFLLTCNIENRAASFEVEISSENFIIQVNEIEGKCRVVELAIESEHIEFSRPLQSQLTQQIVSEILKKNSCGLTQYNESVLLHAPYLSAMLSFFNKHEAVTYSECPIT